MGTPSKAGRAEVSETCEREGDEKEKVEAKLSVKINAKVKNSLIRCHCGTARLLLVFGF